jgi:hypothetical protein
MLQHKGNRGSSVNIVTRIQAEPTWFDSRQGIFLMATASRAALGTTQPHIQWVPEALSPRVKREADHPFQSNADVKNAWSYITTFPYVLMVSWWSTGNVFGGNFTFTCPLHELNASWNVTSAPWIPKAVLLISICFGLENPGWKLLRELIFRMYRLLTKPYMAWNSNDTAKNLQCLSLTS